MKRRIALIEDDEVISGNYADFLSTLGFDVDAYLSKEDALAGLAATLPDLVLLDIMMNGERDAGFAICAEIRRRTSVLPIIFLTSHDGEVEKISGLRLGADDYITKDVSLDYLVIRIEALFRRLEAYASAKTNASVTLPRPSEDDLVFDADASTFHWKSQRLDLTLTQVWMLQELRIGRGQTKSHTDLMQAAKLVVERNTITAHVKAIRDVFLSVDPTFDHIHTERGRGYRWVSR